MVFSSRNDTGRPRRARKGGKAERQRRPTAERSRVMNSDCERTCCLFLQLVNVRLPAAHVVALRHWDVHVGSDELLLKLHC